MRKFLIHELTKAHSACFVFNLSIPKVNLSNDTLSLVLRVQKES